MTTAAAPTPLQREMLLADSFELARALYAAAWRYHQAGLEAYAREFYHLGDRTWLVGMALELEALDLAVPDAAD